MNVLTHGKEPLSGQALVPSEGEIFPALVAPSAVGGFSVGVGLSERLSSGTDV